MSNIWNQEAVVVYSDEHKTLDQSDFTITENVNSPHLHKYFVEALHDTYCHIIFGNGNAVYPWIFIRSENLILTPSDVRAKWPEWFEYVKKHGAYGWGL